MRNSAAKPEIIDFDPLFDRIPEGVNASRLKASIIQLSEKTVDALIEMLELAVRKDGKLFIGNKQYGETFVRRIVQCNTSPKRTISV